MLKQKPSQQFHYIAYESTTLEYWELLWSPHSEMWKLKVYRKNYEGYRSVELLSHKEILLGLTLFTLEKRKSIKVSCDICF